MRSDNSNRNMCFLVIEGTNVAKKVNTTLKRYYEFFLCKTNSFDEAIEILKAITVDVIFLDINIRGKMDLELISVLLGVQPSSKIIILTSNSNDLVLKKSFRFGASDYLEKSFNEMEILEVMIKLLQSKNANSTIKRVAAKRPIKIKLVEKLSEREFEVAKLLLKGKRSKEISEKLKVEDSTVSTYKKRIFDKLKIDNIISLNRIFKEAGYNFFV